MTMICAKNYSIFRNNMDKICLKTYFSIILYY